MEARTTVLTGTLAGRTARPNAVYGRGRRCEVEGCTTVISIYNPEAICWSHLALDLPTAEARGSHRDEGLRPMTEFVTAGSPIGPFRKKSDHRRGRARITARGIASTTRRSEVLIDGSARG